MISAVVLAAGLSRRMGRPKLLLPLGGKTVIEQVVTQTVRSKVGEIIVVTGDQAPAIAPALSGYAVRCIFNPSFLQGQGSSVSAGTAAVSPDAHGILFLNGDQPLVSFIAMDALIDGFELSRPLIAAHRGHGPPIIFNVSMRAELLRLRGDQGGRPLLEKYRHAVERLPIELGDEVADLDTPEQFAVIQELWLQNPK